MLGAVDFAGSWSLHREIVDRHLGQTGLFKGSAVLRVTGTDTLHYAETGKVRFGGGPVMVATREYSWQFKADQVDVRFADGAAFHSFTPTGASAGTDHPCGDDFYQVRYDFTHWPTWTAEWVVNGPRKDYTSVSRYIRDL